MMQLQIQSGYQSIHLLPRSSFVPILTPSKPYHSPSLSSTPLLKLVVSNCRRNPWTSPPAINAIALVAVAVVLSTPAPPEETLLNIPQSLSGEICDSGAKECLEGKKRIQRPNSRNAESCTGKCVTTCVRGGDGSPGEGPLNVRGPIVVFKQGFRTRQYCLVECSDICNLIDKAMKAR